jgi:asparagine synthase (glutamine-hydrolysing)
VLRKAAADLVPPSILNRVKQPYRAPDSQAFFVNGAPREWVADVLNDANVRAAGYFNPIAVRRLVDKCKAGKVIGFADNMALVGILSTMIVHDRFVRKTDGLALKVAR